ncbi:MAG TPA: TMEM165/GDT1 family protein [Steroidobacter sp.]|jgi:putative Ca2+/H+ antiporter (TMEM165/GDT1 family)|nr:TMEM165/GDT1 family protein [Steroidobacteraceae bacterium]HLS81481.1 TMEM165/GDT1 family protein [Steroidobacter sp.]
MVIVRQALECAMDPFFVSAAVVALAEIGDKTQLLAVALAARYRKPAPIVLGIFCATLLNHGAAGAFGVGLANLLGGAGLRWALGLGFIAMAAWMLVPDRLDHDKPPSRRLGVFATTLMVFFLVEIGDKTQIATVALAAQYKALGAVVFGTTLGMMIANAPAVYLGDAVSQRLDMRLMHGVASVIFLVLGVLVLASGDFELPA